MGNKEKEAKSELAEAQRKKSDAEAALKAAKKAVARFYPDMKKLMDDFDEGPRQLQQFQESVKADLAVLQTLSAPAAEDLGEAEGAEQAAEGSAAADGAPAEA